MSRKLLIANRGEIACRIIQTAKKLNIQTVAVYSEIDARALHVEFADESYCIGAAPSAASYLNGEKIIQIAKTAGVDAIHPGYGFLAEDDQFATQCQQAGLIFVGPSPQAIQIMGDKNLAKTTMMAAGVPVVPGYQGDTTDLTHLKEMAQKIGFPVLIKASAGGGGKGMRLVHHLDELASALQSAQREAQASFGDSRVFLEKYLAVARHIEVQILFDQYGHGVYLFDRDCSVQRRHQKIIEEAPAPGLHETTRQKMAETALRAGRAIQYCSAGTIEFLVDEQQNFYFMEMNTRLQVEHPVTEMISGLDLVEWQLRIAAGEKLTLKPNKIKINGHAIEARLYAEDPQNNFMPSAGRLHWFQLPTEQMPHIRIDSGFRTGDIVSIYYDPLLAKLIAWGENRQQAINMLQHILDKTAVAGIHTNWTLLNRIIRNPEFIQAKMTTHFIAEQQTTLLATSVAIPEAVISMACLARFNQQQQIQQSFYQASEDKFSPWWGQDNWRLNPAPSMKIFLWQAEKHWQISVTCCEGRWQFAWNEHHWQAIATWQDVHHLHLRIGQQEFSAIILMLDEQIQVFHAGEQWSFSTLNSAAGIPTTATKYGLQAPMPGILIEIYVQPGQTVRAGDRLLVMEAMKMEHLLTAPRAGTIATIFYKPGDRIHEDAELITFTND